MNNSPTRTFVLMGIIVFVLLMMYQLPILSIGNIQLRPVQILSSVISEPEENNIEVIPTTKAPKPVIAKTNSGKTIQFKETWSKGVQPIVDYAEGNTGSMDFFYEQLANVKKLKRPVRIAYYGDSYIEGDIMTCDLRELFQSTYGGNGVGWVDCGSAIISSRRSIRQQSNGMREYVAAKKPFDKNLQGISERYFIPSSGAKVKTEGTKFYPHSSKWTNTSLFFYTPSSVNIQYALSNNKSDNKAFTAKSGVQSFEVKDSTQSVSYTFNNVGGGTSIFGMALESNNGVILDNFSMRGSTGLTIADIPVNRLKEFNSVRPYDLIVLHFGLNIAVKGNKLVVMKGYTNRMKTVIEHLKAAFPRTAILVMSVPDRDQRTAEGIKTLPEVKQLVGLQQQLAADTKVSFLNFFEAMGGEGSVSELVERNMANKDYTHISFGGGKVVAKKIFPSFQEGLKNYNKRKALERQ